MKNFIILTLCGVAALSAGAQLTNVEAAKKLAGKTDKIEEARTIIQEAIANPETATSPMTYYIAGKIEWDAFDKNAAKQQTNPDGVNPIDMSNQLLNGYDYYMMVFPLEQNEAKPKYTKELQKKISEKTNKFWDAGANFFNAGKYYPEAYNAFMIFGNMPDLEVLGNQAPKDIPDTLRAIAFHNAGLAAWSANKVDEAAIAFGKARENNYSHPEAYIYELACWQNIEQTDSTRAKEAVNNIFRVARAGYEKFGMEPSVFFTNMVNTMVHEKEETEALNTINDAISKYPQNPALYGLRAFVYDYMDDEPNAEADYRKAACMDGVDYETLRNAVSKILRIGREKWNNIELGDPEIKQKKEFVRTNYFQVAKDWAEKAQGMAKDPSDMDSIIESIDYQLSL